MSTTLSHSAPNPFGAKLGGEVRIGIVTATHPDRVMLQTEIGTQVLLPEPTGELLPRIC